MKKMRESVGGGFEGRPGEFYCRVTVAPQKRQGGRAPWATTLDEATERGKRRTGMGEPPARRGATTSSSRRSSSSVPRRPTRRRSRRSPRRSTCSVAGDFDAASSKPKVKGAVTFESFSMQWVRGELAAQHPDYVERKRSAYTDSCYLRKYAFPVIGPKGHRRASRLADFELHHERTRRGGRCRRSSTRGTRRHVAQAVRRVMQLAEYPAKLIERNPIPSNALPQAEGRTTPRSSSCTPRRTRAKLWSEGERPATGTSATAPLRLPCIGLVGAVRRRSAARSKCPDDAVETDDDVLEEVPPPHVGLARPASTASCTWTARRPGALGPSRSIRTSCRRSRAWRTLSPDAGRRRLRVRRHDGRAHRPARGRRACSARTC